MADYRLFTRNKAQFIRKIIEEIKTFYPNLNFGNQSGNLREDITELLDDSIFSVIEEDTYKTRFFSSKRFNLKFRQKINNHRVIATIELGYEFPKTDDQPSEAVILVHGEDFEPIGKKIAQKVGRYVKEVTVIIKGGRLLAH